MKTIALIPARYAATRFPGKLMQQLGDKSIIRQTYENTKATLLFDEVIVVTDSEIIFEEITRYGGYAIMSKGQHESGSDRIAEAIQDLQVDIVVNVQGDEPFVKKSVLNGLLNAFHDEIQVQVASLMHPMTLRADIENPNHVKVVTDAQGYALYFSRSVIPYPRDADAPCTWYKHIGIYAFRKEALLNFTYWGVSTLEAVEKLEQLRYLENGLRIKMVETNEAPISIDTPEDLEKARAFLASRAI